MQKLQLGQYLSCVEADMSCVPGVPLLLSSAVLPLLFALCAHDRSQQICPGYCDTFSGQHFKPEFDQGSNRLQLAHHKVVVEFVNRGTCETMTMQVNFMRLEVAACSGWLLLGV